MKKMKLTVVMAALVASLGFTSCLDSAENGGTAVTSVPLKVGYDYSTLKTIFTDPAGTKYIPTTSATISGEKSQLALVAFSYEYDQLAAQSQKIDITLLGTPEYIPERTIIKGEVPEENTVSVSSLESRNSMVWGYNNYLILNPVIYINKSTTNDNLDEELKKHRFTLYYSGTEATESGVLTLQLRYQITNETSEEDLTDYTMSDPYYYVYFDLTSAISTYENVNGTYPKQLKVEYEIASTSAPTMDSSKKRTQTVSFNLVEKQDSSL